MCKVHVTCNVLALLQVHYCIMALPAMFRLHILSTVLRKVLPPMSAPKLPEVQQFLAWST